MLLRALLSIPDVGQIDAFAEPWRRLYSQSPLLSTLILFGHLGGLLAAGGLTVAADRATLRLDPRIDDERRRHLAELAHLRTPVWTALGVALVAAGQARAADAAPASMNIGRSEVSARVWLDSHGIASQVDSVVHGVTVGVARIETVSVSVLCRARGLRGTASCDFFRQILGVSIDGVPTAPSGCTDRVNGVRVDRGCGALQDALNAVYSPYLVFSMPLPDRRPGYVAGSLGGYQAVAQKELYEYLQDSLVSYDSSLQIPGLEMLYVNDSAQSPSRLDVQLADVQSEARLGLSTQASCALGCDQRHDKPPVLGDHKSATPISPTAALARPAVDGAPGDLADRDVAVLRRVLDGLRWLVRTPGEAALIALTLALLTSPLGLAARRRRLDLLDTP